jgi:hypothetical protein
MLTPSPFPNQRISPHKTHPTLLHTRVNHNTIAIAITYTNKFSPFSPSHTILPRRQQIVNREKVKSRRIKKKNKKQKNGENLKVPHIHRSRVKLMAFCRGNPRLLRGCLLPLSAPLCALCRSLSSYFSRVNHRSSHAPLCSCFRTRPAFLWHSPGRTPVRRSLFSILLINK